MKLAEWIAIVGVVVTLIAGGFAAWSTQQARLESVAKDVEQMNATQRILREALKDLLEDVNRLKGQHDPHPVESSPKE